METEAAAPARDRGPVHIRPERPEDIAAIRQVHLAAFGAALEADLVDALREEACPIVSLVAEDGEGIVGHIVLSPVTLAGDPRLPAMGLAPVAVIPARQRQGIGAALVRAGLHASRETGCRAVVVLGHAEYYPRFGFTQASRFGLVCEYAVPDENFMALELTPGALRGAAGRVSYHPAFPRE